MLRSTKRPVAAPSMYNITGKSICLPGLVINFLNVSVYASPVLMSDMIGMLEGGGAKGSLSKNKYSLSLIQGSVSNDSNKATASW